MAVRPSAAGMYGGTWLRDNPGPKPRPKHKWGLFPPKDCICLCHVRDYDAKGKVVRVRSDKSCHKCYDYPSTNGGGP